VPLDSGLWYGTHNPLVKGACARRAQPYGETAMTIRSAKTRLPSARLVALLSLVALLLAVIFAVGMATSSASDKAVGTTVIVPVTGMSCVSCAATIKRTVKNIDGVSNVEVSLAARTMRVTYAPARVSPDRIVAAVNALGYQAGTPVEAK